MVLHFTTTVSESGIAEAIEQSFSRGQLALLTFAVIIAILISLVISAILSEKEKVQNNKILQGVLVIFPVLTFIGSVWIVGGLVSAKEEARHDVMTQNIQQNFDVTDIKLQSEIREDNRRVLVSGESHGKFIEFTADYVPAYDLMMPVHGIEEHLEIPVLQDSALAELSEQTQHEGA